MRFLSYISATTAIIAISPVASAFAEPVSIPLWYGQTGQLGEAIERVCEAFNGSQDDFRIDCLSQGGYPEAIQTAIAAYRAGGHPAILQSYDAGTTTLMLSGAIYPAYQLMEDMGYNVDWDDYIESVSNYYATSDGRLYSFPFNSSSAVHLVNLDTYEAHGLNIPETWEDLIANLTVLRDAGHACPYGFHIDAWIDMEQFSAIHNEPIATRDNGYGGLDAEFIYNTTLYRDHIANQVQWIEDGLMIFQDDGYLGAINAFAQGNCAHLAASIARHGQVYRDQAEGLNWTTYMIPHYEGHDRHNTIVGGASWWVLDGFDDDVYEGAAAFFEFIRQPEQQLEYSTMTGYIPLTNSAFEYFNEIGFYDRPENQGKETAVESLRYTPVTPVTRGIRLGNFVQARAVLTEELENIFSGDKSVDDGLADAVRRANAHLRQFEATYPDVELP
jgi:sn-glycerol 3-phosphate transport system substrate-binding protein